MITIKLKRSILFEISPQILLTAFRVLIIKERLEEKFRFRYRSVKSRYSRFIESKHIVKNQRAGYLTSIYEKCKNTELGEKLQKLTKNSDFFDQMENLGLFLDHC